MAEFSRRQSSGTYAATVHVFVCEHSSRLTYRNVVTVVTDEPATRVDLEEEALNIMVEQVVREGSWGMVTGAICRPLEGVSA